MKTINRNARRLSILMILLSLTSCGDSLEVGDTWIYEINKDNPFEAALQYEYEIVELKNGYVLFRDLSTGRLASESQRYFLIGSHKRLTRGD